ncbi:RNA recognition motif domain-containing protein [Ditylenchus destructor]|uniref:RNA recognition motif domain-containing protein n=1 Tax=Ditylenchus destructor TaxID=166010 RepID=A0AAD4N3H7_9BILA|nr:RNA recognition motif domain-containing protein [Ditylenchus destructor]
MKPASVWSGDLPKPNYKMPRFSAKIFVGGVPWNVEECTLLNAFRYYGPCHVEWPTRSSRSKQLIDEGKPTGYVYIAFKNEMSVSLLLLDCIQTCATNLGEYFFSMRTGKFDGACRKVEIIPWIFSDTVYSLPYSHGLRYDSWHEDSNTVFVGALHGLITASALATIMEETFGGIIMRVTINTDKYNYPIGSGHVTFADNASYNRAIKARFLVIRTSKFVKKIQIDPYKVPEKQLCEQCCQCSCHEISKKFINFFSNC